jgi:uncharacterized protein
VDIKGSRLILAPRDQVWAALNSPEMLKTCIPGCERLTGTPEKGLEAKVSQKIGPVSATFNGALLVSNVVPGESYTIAGEGKGGAAGLAKGSADVSLRDVEGGTQLDYAVTAMVGGRLAQLGTRLIDGFARKMADTFFDKFQLAVEGPIEPAAPADVTDESAEKPGWFARLMRRNA